MRSSRVLESPTTFVVEDYTPGLTISFRDPTANSDLARAREAVDLEPWRSLPFEEQIERADLLCRQLSVSERAGDFGESLKRFGESEDVRVGLAAAATAFGLRPEADTVDTIAALLEQTGVFQRASHFSVRLYCHDPQAPTALEEDATHFGFILDGDPGLRLELPDGRHYPLYPHSYFCVPGAGRITGAGRVELLTSFGTRGLLSLGGPIEPWGRLKYIDGCTDTMLVPPARLGAPCFNALYFPAETRQTQHTHPSLRAGIVVSGEGVCKTPNGDHALVPGRIFFLPPETWHAFHTGDDGGQRSALTVIAFHPDSDFGPTDDDHPMLNRTYFQFLHRLRSSLRTRASEPASSANS